MAQELPSPNELSGAQIEDVEAILRKLLREYTGIGGYKVFWLGVVTLFPIVVRATLAKFSSGHELSKILSNFELPELVISFPTIVYSLYHILGIRLYFWVHQLWSSYKKFDKVAIDRIFKEEVLKASRLHRVVTGLSYVVLFLIFLTLLTLVRIRGSEKATYPLPLPSLVYSLLGVEAPREIPTPTPAPTATASPTSSVTPTPQWSAEVKPGRSGHYVFYKIGYETQNEALEKAKELNSSGVKTYLVYSSNWSNFVPGRFLLVNEIYDSPEEAQDALDNKLPELLRAEFTKVNSGNKRRHVAGYYVIVFATGDYEEARKQSRWLNSNGVTTHVVYSSDWSNLFPKEYLVINGHYATQEAANIKLTEIRETIRMNRAEVEEYGIPAEAIEYLGDRSP